MRQQETPRNITFSSAVLYLLCADLIFFLFPFFVPFSLSNWHDSRYAVRELYCELCSVPSLASAADSPMTGGPQKSHFAYQHKWHRHQPG